MSRTRLAGRGVFRRCLCLGRRDDHPRVGDTEPWTITPRVKKPNRVGITVVDRLAPLLAPLLDAITDEGDRLHILTVLESAAIYLCDEPRPGFTAAESRDEGRIVTSYRGTRQIPAPVVLDLAEQIRAELARA